MYHYTHYNNHRFPVIIAILLVVPGCVHVPSYRIKPLTFLSHRFDDTVVKKDVTIRVKRMTKREAVELFGPRGRWFFKSRRNMIIPLHISIYNHSITPIITGPNNISMFCMYPPDVIHRLQSRSGLWALRSCICGLPISLGTLTVGFSAAVFGHLLGSDGIIQAGWATIIAGSSMLIATPIWAISNAAISHSINKKIKADIMEKILDMNTTVQPYEHIDTLIFVHRRDLQKACTFSWITVEDEPKTVVIPLTIPLHIKDSRRAIFIK
jgi:hypothetical protein